ncbi:MAG: hypothetical protein ABI200_06990, partial [Gaiellales bacterium]
TGSAAGDVEPQLRSIEEIDLGGPSVTPSRDWTRRQKTTRSDVPLLLQWLDEKGSVVRLISSSTESPDERRTNT